MHTRIYLPDLFGLAAIQICSIFHALCSGYSVVCIAGYLTSRGRSSTGPPPQGENNDRAAPQGPRRPPGPPASSGGLRPAPGARGWGRGYPAGTPGGRIVPGTPRTTTPYIYNLSTPIPRHTPPKLKILSQENRSVAGRLTPNQQTCVRFAVLLRCSRNLNQGLRPVYMAVMFGRPWQLVGVGVNGQLKDDL